MSRAIKVEDARAVYVEWRDAISLSGWMSAPEDDEAQACRCATIGWLIRQSKHDLVVAQTLNEQGDVGDIITIPAQWCLKVVKLAPIGGRVSLKGVKK